MSEETKKVVLPAYLMRRLEAFRIAKGGEHSYLIRDKALGKTYDFEPWQFFVLEVLPGCESLEKLQSVFQDRFNRQIGKQDLDELFASIADRKLFDENATKHPLLLPFTRRTFEVHDGKAHPKPLTGGAPAAEAPAGAAAAAAAPAAALAKPDEVDLPAGIQDAVDFDPRASRWMLPLFDPRPLLRLLSPLVRPLRHLVYAVPLLLVLALSLAFRHSGLLLQDLDAVRRGVNLFEHLIFVLLTINLAVVLTSAFVAHHFRAVVHKLGIALYFKFVPRFATRMSNTEQITRRESMWLHGSALLVRLMLFSAGVLVWYNTRDTQTALPSIALTLMFASAAGILLEAGNPLVKGNGYFLLSAYLNEPHLRGKAYRALLNKLRGGVYQAADSSVLALYALASATYVVLFVLALGWLLSRFLYWNLGLGGVAIVITLALVAYLLYRNYAGLKKFGRAYDRSAQFDRWRKRTLPKATELEEGAGPQKASYWWRALAVCLLLALLLPYPYEPGGAVVVFPERRAVLSTDTPGLIEAVYFDGGETVKEGTVIARLAHAEYTSQVKVIEARMLEQQAVIADLRSRPKAEDVQLAQQALQVARAREAFSRERAPRLEKLYQAGAVSFEEFDSARRDHFVDLEQVAEKEAALAVAKLGATPDKIAAAEANLVSLQEERDAYAARIERSSLRMPFDGNILSLHLKDRVNSFLDRGQPFASVESAGSVTAEIEVAESDMQYVKLGSRVRLRPVAYFADEFDGEVTLIDRNVTVKSFGNVVKVTATVDNRNGALKTGMTGYAKIEGATMPIWQAFSQALIRFFKVQIWSWVP